MDQLEEGMKLMRKASKAAGIYARNEELKILKKLGGGNKKLVGRLKRDRSPVAILNTMEQQEKEIEECRKKISVKLESLYKTIVSKKKEREQAFPDRKCILDAELMSLLTQYKVLERQLDVFRENECLLEQMKDLFMECLDYDMRRIDEMQVAHFNKYLKEKGIDSKTEKNSSADSKKADKCHLNSDEFDLDAELEKFKENGKP